MAGPHSNDTPEARFGAELRRLRMTAGLSQRDLADALHRVASTISEFESGRRLPRTEVAEQYEQHFGLPRGTLVMALQRARAERLDRPADGILDEDLAVAACPYKGLRAFEREDAALFFGRESQVEQVAARLARTRFVAVVGPSGSGKSSFVRAGLLAHIDATWPAGDTSVPAAILTPGEHPLDELVAAVGAATDGARDLRTDPDRLGDALRQACGPRFVIVVDQLEELFTVCRDEAERGRFVAALMDAWRDPSSPVVVILALRADFYGHLTAYPELAAAVVANQALIGRLSRYDLGRAIELPAAHAGLQLQAGLAETMLDDLGGEPGTLPLLSHGLLETWKRRRRSTLTVGGYREAGGVRGAIAQTAEDVLQGLPEADRAIARAIFLSLTDVAEGAEPARRRVDRADLAGRTDASVDRVLGILADARLVTLDERTVVVAHEALIRHWPRLRGWIESDRAGLIVHRRLSDAARQWEALQRDPGALYRGAGRAAAREWATEHAAELSPLEHDFLAASDAAAQRSTRRLRVLAGGLAMLSMVVAALAVLALSQRDDARDQRAAAQRRAGEATSLALVAASARPLATRPDIALAIAFEAYRAAPRPEARSAVVRALLAARESRVRGVAGPQGARSIAFSPDGKLFAVTGLSEALVIDRATGRLLSEPSGHTSPVDHVAFSPDSKIVATAAMQEVRLSEARTGRSLGRLRDGRPPPGAPQSELPPGINATDGPHYSYEAIAFSRDGERLATASDDGRVRLWDVKTRKPLARLAGHRGKVCDVAFSPDGTTLASAGVDGTARIWDPATGVQRRRIAGHAGAVRAVAFSPDGETLATAGADGTARLWDPAVGRQVGRIAGHGDEVRDVAFSPDGRTLATAGLDGPARLWDAATREPTGRLRGHAKGVSALAFSPDGKTLGTVGLDETIRLWDPRPPKQVRLGHSAPVDAVAFSPDGETLASAGARDGMVRLWDARTWRQRGRLDADGVVALAFSPDGTMLATGGASDATVRLWDPTTRTERGRLGGHTSGVRAVAFSPDSKTLGAGGDGGVVHLWDLATRKDIRDRMMHDDRILALAFSPARKKTVVAGGDQDEDVFAWDAETGDQVGAIASPESSVRAIAFSPDGKLVASARLDGTTALSNTTRPELGLLTGHAGDVNAVAFSPDGRTLVTGGDDATVRLWNPATRTQAGSLTGHDGAVNAVAISPDGRTIASAGDDHAVRIWGGVLWSGLAELRAIVCDMLLPGLNKLEWGQYAAGIPYRRSCP